MKPHLVYRRGMWSCHVPCNTHLRRGWGKTPYEAYVWWHHLNRSYIVD